MILELKLDGKVIYQQSTNSISDKKENTENKDKLSKVQSTQEVD